MPGKMKLYNFLVSGREETARLMFAYTGVKYEDIRVTEEEWRKLKKDMPFRQLPVLDVDGQLICQSGTILRYAAKQCKLNGRNDEEEAIADMVTDCILDLMMVLPWAEEDPEKKALRWKKALEETIPAMLGYLQEILVKSGGDYFTGQLSYADFAILNAGDFLLCQRKEIFDLALKLKAHMDKIKALPNVAEWMAQRPG